jgi:hypothetical protein
MHGERVERQPPQLPEAGSFLDLWRQIPNLFLPYFMPT